MNCRFSRVEHRNFNGDHSLYQCQRVGCRRHVVLKAGQRIESMVRPCRHPAMFEPGEVVHWIAARLGFRECLRCKQRRAAFNRWSIPVPGLVYLAVRWALGKPALQPASFQAASVAKAMKRRIEMASVIEPLEQDVRRLKQEAKRARVALAEAERKLQSTVAGLLKGV